MSLLQMRWKLACYTALCLMFLPAAFKVGQPVSFANVFGGFCIVLFTCSALVLMWAWLKLPGLMKVSTAAVPEDIACKRRDELYGPAFPLGRYDEMCLRAGSRTGAAEIGNPLTLCVPLRDAAQVLQLGELVYQSMWQSALDYSACKDQSRSSDAAAEAMDFLLLRTVQEALARLYERETSQKAEEIEYFRLPEQNIARQVR